MKISWVAIGLALCTVVPSSNAKPKRKILSSKPHVSHAESSQDSTARNLGSNPAPVRLSNLVTTSPRKQAPRLKAFLKTYYYKKKLTFKEIRRLFRKNVRSLSEKRRRKATRRLKKEIANLKRLEKKSRKKCKTMRDCGENECCLRRFNRKHGYCKRRPKLRQQCKMALLPGLDSECPCQGGLTCELPKIHKTDVLLSAEKPRCQRIKYTDTEIEQQAITGLEES
ncbi:predicted protein [Nematostella vectensis]|uniref:Uncharacterized protein n=1 Tax=Nematostella vectensis TaxID=45351 RepID=A7SDJ3_NEMVE|nr:uncharacterized protein LOC5509840 [Nematostella vectensis]XP_032234694.1 uncharacterized protein LOC5509840 [Nematostella vectensis]EDO38236.1 predicted protein [Nematostella vectensis]|eukprot:XP_001630299.1 predicted protein [Nematostella vectensis]